MLVVTEIVNCMFNDKKDKLNEKLFIVLKMFRTFLSFVRLSILTHFPSMTVIFMCLLCLFLFCSG